MIPNSDQIKNAWENNGNYYGTQLEKSYLPHALSMANMAKFEEAQSILEVGCGSGVFTTHILQQLKRPCSYIAIDISEEMIKIAEKRKSEIQYDDKIIKQEFKTGDAENLAMIPNEYADLYISCLCLHIVNNPNQMLKEAKRVMKKGARFAFSVLGKERCTKMTLFDDQLKKMKVEMPEMRSPHYLGDKQSLISLIEKEGLEVEYCWPILIVLNYDTEGYMKYIKGLWTCSVMIKDFSKEQLDQMKTLIDEELKKLKETYTPLTLEFIIVIGKKPSQQQLIIQGCINIMLMKTYLFIFDCFKMQFNCEIKNLKKFLMILAHHNFLFLQLKMLNKIVDNQYLQMPMLNKAHLYVI